MIGVSDCCKSQSGWSLLAWLDLSALGGDFWCPVLNLALTGITGPLRSGYNCHSAPTWTGSKVTYGRCYDIPNSSPLPSPMPFAIGFAIALTKEAGHFPMPPYLCPESDLVL